MKPRRQIDNRRLEEVGVVLTKIKLAKLIRQAPAPVLCHVEEVGNEADSRTLVDHPRIIRVQIELRVKGRASELAAAANGNLTGIQVNRMRQKTR